MLTCFYRENGKIATSSEAGLLKRLPAEQVVWVDLENPHNEEQSLIEQLFELELFTRQEAEEIESSSKYFESAQEINANINYIYHKSDGYAMDPVSFILKSGLLVTQRTIPLRSFDEVKRGLVQNRRPNVNGYNIFIMLFDARIDIEADFLEDLSKKIYATGRELALDPDVKENALLDIFKFQEVTILFRESTSELKRLFSSILRSDYFPQDEYHKLGVMIKDADSLLQHTAFNFERLEYLQNTFLGLVNMEQTKIVKIFTVVTVIFMPPTLIASLYGMNFNFMPELQWKWGYPFAISLMFLSSVFTLFYFRRKHWL